MRDGEDKAKVKRYRDLRVRVRVRVRKTLSGASPLPHIPPNALPSPMPSTPVERWETFVSVLYANAERHADFLADQWPDIAFPRYAVQTLIPQLNAIGEQGWEPVSVQPVIIGTNGDVIVPSANSREFGGGMYSNQHLCVFKRRKA